MVMWRYHPLDGITYLKYKLVSFWTPNIKISMRKALAFNWNRCCHLALCLLLILFHSNLQFLDKEIKGTNLWKRVGSYLSLQHVQASLEDSNFSKWTRHNLSTNFEQTPDNGIDFMILIAKGKYFLGEGFHDSDTYFIKIKWNIGVIVMAPWHSA